MPSATPPRAELRVVSMFSGIGGLDLGLQRAGHHIVEMCECWDPARRVLGRHFPGTPLHDDVQTYTPAIEYDVLAAGFPCTDLSHAGSKAGIFGSKSGLVSHVFRIAEDSAPDWVVIENVPNLLSLHAGAGIAFVTSELERLGYRWAYRTVDSRFTGVPQRRPRVLLVASRVHQPAAVLLQEDCGPRADDALGDLGAAGFYWTEGRNGLGLVPGAIPTLKGGSTLGLPSAPAVWIPSNARGRRVLLPGIEDGEALQGLPRGWTSGATGPGERNLRWKLVGNAVTVGVAEWLGTRLARQTEWNEPTQVAGTAIDRNRAWPPSGWGDSQGAWGSDVSAWPQHVDPVPLSEIVVDGTPLSYRATVGFLSRVEEAGRKLPRDLARDLEEHITHHRPALPEGRHRSGGRGTNGQVGLEATVRRLLHGRGLRYRLHVRPSEGLRQRVAIAFMAERVAVDIRSCYWHRCSECTATGRGTSERWTDKIVRNVARDNETAETLRSLGWKVVIAWEHEDPAAVANEVEAVVRSRRYSPAATDALSTERATG